MKPKVKNHILQLAENSVCEVSYDCFKCGDLSSLAQRHTPNVSKFQTRQTHHFQTFLFSLR